MNSMNSNKLTFDSRLVVPCDCRLNYSLQELADEVQAGKIKQLGVFSNRITKATLSRCMLEAFGCVCADEIRSLRVTNEEDLTKQLKELLARKKQ